METVEVWRGETTTDVDGNVMQGDPALVKSLRAMVEPVSSIDQAGESSRPVTVGYTVYVRGDATGVKDTDLLRIRGRLLPVKGFPQVWDDLYGRHVGDVITVGNREG